MTIQVSIFEQLIALVADPALAEQLRTRYYEDLRAQTSFVQHRIGNLEIDLRETLQQSLGVTNTMIADALTAVREVQSAQQEQGADVLAAVREVQSAQSEQGAAVAELRATFQEVAESVDHLAERDAQQYQESQQIHAELHARHDRAEAEIERLATRMDEAHDRIIMLEARLAARPSPEKAQATYDGVQQMQRDFTRLLDHLGVTLDESDYAAER